MSTIIEIEVVFALASTQDVRRARVPATCTAAEAIRQVGLHALWQSYAAQPLSLACYGRLITPDTVLQPGDRVEILRPLQQDPKETRRQRAKVSARRARTKEL